MAAGLQDVSQRAPQSLAVLARPLGVSLRNSGIGGRESLAAVAIVLALGACSTVDDLFNDSSPAPSSNSKSGDYPKLQTVPTRPDRPTPPAGLSGDRSNARYTDSDVKPVNEAANAVVGQQLTASTPVAPPGSNAPPVNNAVQSAPVTSSAPPPAAAAQTGATQSAAPQAAPGAVAPLAMPQMTAVAPQAPIAMTASIPPSATQLILPSPSGSRAGAPLPRAPGAVATPTYVPMSGNQLEIAVVQFGRSSAGLDGGSLSVLRDVAAIQRSQGGVIRIVGHASADSVSPDPQRASDDAYRISLARANAIARQLVALGVPRNQITVDAAADSQPEYAPVTATAVAANRRASIFIDL
jgi:outer membrane protein OmpA-like peptidoglycan-associated protein